VVDVANKGKRVTLQPKAGRTLAEAFADFTQAKRVMNVSEETIKHYNCGYRYFVDFFGEGRYCAEVSKDTILDYLAYIREEKPDIAQKTVETYIRGLRTVLYFFMENGWMDEFKINLPRTEEIIKETYTDEEIKRLIKKPDIKTCTFSELRNWAMVCYFIATGNRSSTVADIRIGDVRLQENEVFIRKTKQKKQYILPISGSLKPVLQEYMRFRKGEADDFLFCTANGGQFTKNTLGECMRLYNRSRGVERTGVHLFRHTFAKNWIMNGGDIFRLQKILGHSTLDMVKNYVAIYGSDLKRDYEQYSLLDTVTASGTGQRIKMK
jgi:integrase/recombinase XerD